MRKTHQHSAVATAALAAALALPQAAYAQDTSAQSTAAAPATAPSAAIAAAPEPAPGQPEAAAAATGEIVVTAQRRSENLQKVPLAISVVGGAALAQNNINSAETLQQVVPSLSFKRGTTNSNSTLAIRGIGTQSFSSGAEPSVSTVVDGVVYGRSGMAFQEFADVDRIEVLRGPQGTLFGKNASAGALNIVTLAPTSRFTADASASYFEGDEVRATANVSGPISENARFRVSGVYGSYDGNIRNVYNGDTINGYKRYGVRAKIVDEIGDLKLTLSGDYTHAKDDCCADVLGTFIPNAEQANIFLPNQRPVVPGRGSYSVNNNFAPGTRDTNAGVSVAAELALGDYTLTSITAYRKWRNRQLRDGDFGSVSGTYVAPMNIDQRDDGRLNFNQYSEELRIASPSGRTLEYVAGVFLWRTDEQDDFTRSTAQCSASTLPVDATGFRPCAPGASTYVYGYAPAQWDTHFRSYSGFGQATLNLSDSFRVIGGLRYTHDHVYYDYSRVRIGPAVTGVAASFAASESAKDEGWSGKAGVQWQATPDIMAYATYSRGYKGPALNVFYSMGVNNLGKIDPEKSDAYEAGIKAKLLDRRLTLNLAGFWQDFSNFQANTFATVNNTVLVSLTNAGKVRTRGFEMDFTYNATDALSFSGGYTFNDAKITDFACAASLTGANLATCLAHNGKPLPFAPRNKFNVSGNWKLPFTDGLPFNVRLGSTVSYTSKTNFDIDQTPLAQQPKYALWDATLTFASKDDRYQLAVIGKNLTDKYYTTFVTPSGNGVAAGSYARLQVPRDAERYVGVRASVRY